MKWTDEINIFVMRAYYRITNLEIGFTAYRDQLCGEFIEKYPGTNVTALRISDQRRVIVRNHKLLPALLEPVHHSWQKASIQKVTAIVATNRRQNSKG